MPSNACVLCMTLLRARATECDSCGLEVLSNSKSRSAAVAMVPSAERKPKRRLPIALAGFACLIGMGMTIMSGHAALSALQPNIQSRPAMPPADPAEAADWRAGKDALRQALGMPSYDSFGGSFMSVSLGRVVSICGTTDPNFDSDGAERYVKVFGSPSISLEFRDPSFTTLWERACTDGRVGS